MTEICRFPVAFLATAALLLGSSRTPEIPWEEQLMSSEIVRFGDFELDRNLYELRSGGRALKLERIPLDLLFLLVDHRDRLVTREEILERVWGKGVFLDADNAINSAVRKIRRALQGEPDTSQFKVTVPTKGYRFVGTSREQDRQPSPRVEAKADGAA